MTKEDELAIRTILGEAAGEPAAGKIGVAHVINNRLNDGRFGRTLGEVILAPRQFSPWNDAHSRRNMYSYSPQSPAFQQAASIWDAIKRGESPDWTGGALNFANPVTSDPVNRRGWVGAMAQTSTAQQIGNHLFGTDPKLAVSTPVVDFDPKKFESFKSPSASSEPVVDFDPKNFESFKSRSAPSKPADFDERFSPDLDNSRPALAAPLIAKAEAEMGRPTQAASGALGALQGLSFNTTDEISGALGATLDRRPDESWAQAYERHSGAARQKIADAEVANPGTYLGGQVAGAVGGAFMAPALGAGVRGAAATGAAYGGLAGAGEGVGLEDRAVKGATGTVVGGALGATLGGLANRLFGAADTAGQPGAREAADRLGVTLPWAVGAENRGIQALGQAARQVPLVGSRIDDSIIRGVEQLGEAAEGVGTRLMGGQGMDRSAAGSVVREGLQGVIDRYSQRADAAYNSVRGMLQPNFAAPLPRTQRVLHEITQARNAAGHRDPDAGLEDIINLATRPATFDGVQRARSDLGKKIAWEARNSGMATGDLKRLYGALSDDIGGVVAQSAQPGMGTKAVQAFRQADTDFAANIAQGAQLDRVLRLGSDEGMINAITRAANAKTGNLTQLREIRGAMRPEDWNVVSGFVASNLGRNPANAAESGFSTAKFATEWRSMSEAARRHLFSDPTIYRSLDDIATVSQRIKGAEQYANRSNTGRVALFGGAVGLGSASGFDPMEHLGKLTAGAGIALALASPATASSMARWVRATGRAAAGTTASTLAAARVASRNFSNTLAEKAGITIDPSELLPITAPEDE